MQAKTRNKRKRELAWAGSKWMMGYLTLAVFELTVCKAFAY